MARVKIIIRLPGNDRSEELPEMRAFYRHFTERLRHSPGPDGWAIEGSRLQFGPQPGTGNTGTHQYLCDSNGTPGTGRSIGFKIV